MATVSEEGALRAAETALLSGGGFNAFLRLPGLAVSGSDAEQLGLGTPQFEDVPVGLAVWRKAGETAALLLGASSINGLMGVRGFGSAQSLFQTAVGLVVDGVLYTIAHCEPLVIAGATCAYRLTTVEPTWI